MRVRRRIGPRSNSRLLEDPWRSQNNGLRKKLDGGKHVAYMTGGNQTGGPLAAKVKIGTAENAHHW
jgi:predicted alpha/beta-hydrolase family hydrolase